MVFFWRWGIVVASYMVSLLELGKGGDFVYGIFVEMGKSGGFVYGIIIGVGVECWLRI